MDVYAYDLHICVKSIIYEHLECLKYAYENGCIYSKENLLKNVKGNIKEWIKQNM